MSNFTIRAMQPGDEAELVRLATLLAAWDGGERQMQHEDFTRYCLGPEKLVTAWLAMQGETALGFATSRDWLSFGGAAKVRSLQMLFVDPAARNQGVASALIQHIRTDATQQGCRRFDTEVAPENENAQRLYAALGFISRSQKNLRLQLMLPATPSR